MMLHMYSFSCNIISKLSVRIISIWIRKGIQRKGLDYYHPFCLFEFLLTPAPPINSMKMNHQISFLSLVWLMKNGHLKLKCYFFWFTPQQILIFQICGWSIQAIRLYGVLRVRAWIVGNWRYCPLSSLWKSLYFGNRVGYRILILFSCITGYLLSGLMVGDALDSAYFVPH